MSRMTRTSKSNRVFSVFAQLIRDPGEPHSHMWGFMANSMAASFLMPARVRTLLLRALGVNISARALVRPRVIIRCSNLSVGPSTTVNYHCVFDNRGGVDIGSRVGIGIGVMFLTTDHDSGDPNCRAGSGISKAITVEDGAYIGSGATVLSGVTIGRGVVVAAGSVVTRDCEADGLYAGITARRIRELATRL